MRWLSTLVVLIACMAGSPSVTHAQSPLTQADSISLVRAAARVALQPRAGAPPSCILASRENVGGPVGRAFVAEVDAVAHALATPDSSAAVLALTLESISGRDTMQVRIANGGTNGAGSRASWINEFGYRFTRDQNSADWHFVKRIPLYFADYEGSAARPVVVSRCLNSH